MTLSTQAFTESLLACFGCASKKTTLPVLGCAKLEITSEDRLRMTATNLDQSIAIELRQSDLLADVNAANFPVCIGMRKSTQIFRALEGQEFDLDVGDGSISPDVKISAGRSSFKLACLPGDEFPAQASDEDLTSGFYINALDLLDMIRSVRHCVSDDISRYVLCSVCFSFAEIEQGKLIVAATCGRRLAEIKVPVENEGLNSKSGNLLIPAAALALLQKNIDPDRCTKIKVATDGKGARFDNLEGTVIDTKLIEGNYPNYRQVIPDITHPHLVIAVDRDLLLQAVRRARLMNDPERDSLKLYFDHHELRVKSDNPSAGSAVEKVPIDYESTAENPLSLCLDSGFLVEALRSFTGEKVNLHLFENEPLYLDDDDSPDFRQIIMPLAGGNR